MAPPEGEVVRIALIQAPYQGDRTETVEHSAAMVEDAASKGATVICLQELFATPYFPQEEDAALFDLSEGADGATVRRFRDVAARTGTTLIVPFFERRAPGVYHNSAAVLDDKGALAGIYRKQHIPHDPNFFEKYYFAPGEPVDGVFKTRQTSLGVRICWDQWFPETARVAALAGAEVLLYPTCIGYSKGDQEVWKEQRDAWITAQRAHAIANGVFVAAANRCGSEDGLTFWGSSFVADPFGRIIAQAGEGDQVLLADLDLSLIESTRRAWPFLRDRRVDLAPSLAARFLDREDEK